jgi:hypothetical protein
MRSCLRSWVAAVLLVVASPLQAQAIREFQLQTVGVLRRDEFIGAGVGVAVRPTGRTRFAVSGTAGASDGALALRAEVLLSYHLFPFRRAGVTPYAGGGVSTLVVRDRASPYLTLTLGVESAPAGRSGWFLEAGVAGGARLAGGWRVRWGGRR